MTKKEAISIIREYVSQQPVEWAGVFGSFARNELRPDSDIDVVVHFKEGTKVSLFDYVGYKQDLEELLGRKVDLVTYKYIRPRLKSYIDKDMQIIFPEAAA